MARKLNPQRRRRRRALQEAEQASAHSWSDGSAYSASSTTALEGSPSRSSELGMLGASAAASNTGSGMSASNCSPSSHFEKSELCAPKVVEADDRLLKRIRSLEHENEQLKAKKENFAYRLIDAEDEIKRCKAQHDVLKRERDEARSWGEALWTEAKEQESRADAAQADAYKFQQAAHDACCYAFNTENALYEAQNNNNTLAYELYQERAYTDTLQAALNKRDELITFGKGIVQGMLQGQHAMQSQVQALQHEVTSLTDKNQWLRFYAGLPPKNSQSSDIIPASTVQCPAGAPEVCFPRLRIGSPLQHAPSPQCCMEGTATFEQQQHLMAQRLHHDLAQRAEHDLAQSEAAAKKTGLWVLIGRALGALFGLGQRKAPLVV